MDYLRTVVKREPPSNICQEPLMTCYGGQTFSGDLEMSSIDNIVVMTAQIMGQLPSRVSAARHGLSQPTPMGFPFFFLGSCSLNYYLEWQLEVY